MSSFVFLELLDRDLNLFFHEISEVVTGKALKHPVHLTVRGPYSSGVPKRILETCRRRMEHDVLRICGVGRFRNPGEEVVFLRVESPNLRRVWYKPDYPIERFGFNPHISVYRGADSSLAESIYRFFQHENLELFCAEYQFVTRVTRQLRMFRTPVAHFPFHLILNGRVSANFVDRLRVVVARHRRRGAPR